MYGCFVFFSRDESLHDMGILSYGHKLLVLLNMDYRVVKGRGFPKVPQSSQTESLGFPSYPLPLNTPGTLKNPTHGADTKGGFWLVVARGYKGVCDKDGCDFNSWRLGDEKFYGRGATEFKVDSKKSLTVVTQFLTEGGRSVGLISLEATCVL